MSTEQMREEFEAWHRDKFKTRHCTGQPTRDMHNGKYDEDYGPKHQQQMWEAWQASRAALVVALPTADIVLNPEAQKVLTDCIGAHAYVAQTITNGRPDLALAEACKWVDGFKKAAAALSDKGTQP